MVVRSSSVSLPHFSFTLPATCFQFPSTRFQSIGPFHRKFSGNIRGWCTLYSDGSPFQTNLIRAPKFHVGRQERAAPRNASLKHYSCTGYPIHVSRLPTQSVGRYGGSFRFEALPL